MQAALIAKATVVAGRRRLASATSVAECVGGRTAEKVSFIRSVRF